MMKNILMPALLCVCAFACLQQVIAKDVSIPKVVLNSPYVRGNKVITSSDLEEIRKNLKERNFLELKRCLVKDLDRMNIRRSLISGGNDAGNGGFVVERWGKFFLIDLLENSEDELYILPHANYIPRNFLGLHNSEELLKALLKVQIFNIGEVEEVVNALSLVKYISPVDIGEIEIVGVKDHILFEQMYAYHSKLVEDITAAARVIDGRIYVNLRVWNRLSQNQRVVLLAHEFLQYLTTRETTLKENQRFIIREVIREVFTEYSIIKAKNSLEEVLNEYSK